MSVAHLGCVFVVIFGVWLVGVSLFALWRPIRAIRAIGQFASTTLINYTELGIRAAVGISFVICASVSRAPQTMSLVGWGLFGSAAILALIPRRWHSSYARYWANRIPPSLVYVFAPISFLVGGFLVFEFGVRFIV